MDLGLVSALDPEKENNMKNGGPGIRTEALKHFPMLHLPTVLAAFVVCKINNNYYIKNKCNKRNPRGNSNGRIR